MSSQPDIGSEIAEGCTTGCNCVVTVRVRAMRVCDMYLCSFRQGQPRRGLTALAEPDDSNLFLFLLHAFNAA